VNADLVWLVAVLLVLLAAAVGLLMGALLGLHRHLRRRQREDAAGWRS